MNDIDEAPGKVWFWDLEKAVIDADRCVQCGVCVAACPTDSIGIGEDDLPTLVKMCTGCSLCWDFCPRGGLQYEKTWKIVGNAEARTIEGIGHVEESYTARVDPMLEGVQDGGVVTISRSSGKRPRLKLMCALKCFSSVSVTVDNAHMHATAAT